MPFQVEDRVADELSRAVEGRLAATIGLDDVDLRALRDVQLAVVGAPAERDRRRMLEQEDCVRERALGDRRRDVALEIPGLALGDDPEIGVRPLHAREP